MRLRILFVAGVGLGFVLGARAGRERYLQLRSKANEAWSDPRVIKARAEAARYAREQAPVVRDAALSAATKAAETAKDVASKTAESAKDLATKTAAQAKDIAAKTTESAKDISAKTAESAKELADKTTDSAKEAAAKVNDAAAEARTRVTETAHDVRDRLNDSAEGALASAVVARDEALATFDDDDDDDTTEVGASVDDAPAEKEEVESDDAVDEADEAEDALDDGLASEAAAVTNTSDVDLDRDPESEEPAKPTS